MNPRIEYRNLGLVAYERCWEMQQRLFEDLLARKADPAQKKEGLPHHNEQVGTVLFVEHPPVYTLGKSGHAENMLLNAAQLEALGARLIRIDRGGDITFHGPGQLVGYPILDLERIGLGLRQYIEALEECVIGTIARYGIRGGRIAGASGVWLDSESRFPRKICAIGVRSSRFVTMHGFALNVTTDLGWFSRIHPCGFSDRGVASIESETGLHPALSEVAATVAEELARVLGCATEPPHDGDNGMPDSLRAVGNPSDRALQEAASDKRQEEE